MCVKAKVIDPFRAAAQKEFLVTTKNAFLPVKRNYSMNTYSRISIGAHERSERWEQMNIFFCFVLFFYYFMTGTGCEASLIKLLKAFWYILATLRGLSVGLSICRSKSVNMFIHVCVQRGTRPFPLVCEGIVTPHNLPCIIRSYIACLLSICGFVTPGIVQVTTFQLGTSNSRGGFVLLLVCWSIGLLVPL